MNFGSALELLELAKEIKKCKKCELAKTRKNVVVGKGAVLYPSILFVGEAPGVEEDNTGIPFVGRAGKMLQNWIDEIGLNHKTDYAVINVVKCIPLENGKIRKPSINEIEACREWTEAQIKLLKPRLIVALGVIASQFLLDNFTLTMSAVQNKKFSTRFGEVFCFPHPAYFLRRKIEPDISLLKKVILDYVNG